MEVLNNLYYFYFFRLRPKRAAPSGSAALHNTDKFSNYHLFRSLRFIQKNSLLRENEKENEFPQLTLYNLRSREGSEDLLHHGEVLPVVVGLEQREPQVQLEHDAA